jgi:hypothetical protein
MAIIFDGINNTISSPSIANTQISGVLTGSQIANNAIGVSQMNSTVMSLFPYTNKIINGDFRIWQRGTSFSGVSSGQYTTDRWMVSYRTAGVTVAKQNNQYYQAVRLTNTDGSVQSFDFEQRIEDTSQFDNTTYTLSFYARASTAVTVASQVYANYGGGGSPQDTVNVVNHSVTTTRTRFTMSLVFPDMSAKSIADPSWVRVLLSPTSLPSNAWVEYDSVQVNYGSTALPFQTRHIQQELAMCERYYEKSYNLESTIGSFTVGWAGTSTNGTVFAEGPGLRFKTKKRANPTVTLYNAVSGASARAYQVSSAASITVATRNVGTDGIGIIDYTSSGGQNSYYIHYTAEIEL